MQSRKWISTLFLIILILNLIHPEIIGHAEVADTSQPRTLNLLAPFQVYANGHLHTGLNMGVNTSGNQHNWVTNLFTMMRASYPTGQSWGAIFITVGAPAVPGMRKSINLGNYHYLRVEMRGGKGGEKLSIGIKDKYQLDDGTETKKPVQLTTAWKTYTFKLQGFTGTNLTKIYIPIEFVFGNTGAETIYFRNMHYLP